MNIFGSDIANRSNLNRMGNQTSSQVLRAGQTESVSGAERASSGAGLAAGQVFEGEIVDITPKNVTIRLDNQQMLNARLGESMELSIGQKMIFEVKEQQGDQVVIHPKPDANMSGQNMAAVKALTANGLTVSERNVQIASALMEAGLPLNKDSMRKVMQQSMNFPETNVKNLVSMNQLGIPVNSANITQFEAYSGHEHQMTAAIHQVLDGLEQAFSEVAQSGGADGMQELSQELSRIFEWGEASVEGNTMPVEEGSVQTAGQELVENGALLQEIGDPAAGTEGLAVKEDSLQGTVGSETVSQNEAAAGTDGRLSSEGTGVQDAPSADSAGRSEAGGMLQGDTNSTIQGGNAQTETMNQAASGSVQTPADGMSTEANRVQVSLMNQAGTDTELLQNVKEQLSSAGIPEDTVNQMMNQSKSYGDLVNQITTLLADPNRIAAEAQSLDPDRSGAKQIFASDGFRKLLKKAVQDEWLMKPEEMKSPKEIDEFYKKMLRQSADLEQSLNSGGSGNKQFSESAGNMRDNISFMQQLNEQFVYAQMPMNMNGAEANSELYVYANKKKLQQSTDGVKVLLHLDMPNLGSTDILVRLKDKKLHASFRMADQTSMTVVADNMSDLQSKMEAKGFVFSNEVIRQERHVEGKQADEPEKPSDAVIDEMFNQDLVTGMKRFTFDIRG